MLLPMLLQKPVYILHLFGSTHWKWELRSKKKEGMGAASFIIFLAVITSVHSDSSCSWKFLLLHMITTIFMFLLYYSK
jgi:hypothetical protein